MMRYLTFDNFVGVFSIVATIVVFIAPILIAPALVAVLYEFHRSDTSSEHVTEATVGIGVILRATMRRIFQSGIRNAMQTTVGTFARATARALTRRVLRLASRAALLLFRAELKDSTEAESEKKPSSLIMPVVIGVLVLAATFGALLLLPGHEGVDRLEALRRGANVDAGSAQFSLIAVSFAAAAPMVIYALLAYFATRVSGIQLSFDTGVDSVLMQAYFTGGGSFLPLATDSHFTGSPRQCAMASIICLGGLLLSSAALFGVYLVVHVPIIGFISQICVVYAFIYSFPILPLDGGHLWRVSKLLWFACWLVVLAVFAFHIPESFNVIL